MLSEPQKNLKFKIFFHNWAKYSEIPSLNLQNSRAKITSHSRQFELWWYISVVLWRIRIRSLYIACNWQRQMDKTKIILLPRSLATFYTRWPALSRHLVCWLWFISFSWSENHIEFINSLIYSFIVSWSWWSSQIICQGWTWNLWWTYSPYSFIPPPSTNSYVASPRDGFKTLHFI